MQRCFVVSWGLVPSLGALSTGELLLVACPALVVLAAVLVYGAARRRDVELAIGTLSRETVRRDRRQTSFREPAAPSGREVERAAALERRAASGPGLAVRPTPPVSWVPPTDEQLGVTRRQFLNRSVLNVSGFGLAVFGAATIAFLWPAGSGGFGSKLRIGGLSDVATKIAEGSGFAYYPEGRMWVTEYPAESLEKARAVYDAAVLAGMEAGLVALYQKCPHLGCRVPQCVTSQWFECPCHGSQYNRVGEKKGGPAPRGMDRFPVTIERGSVNVDTGVIVQGPPIGTNTTGQEAEGPHCINVGGGGH